MAKKCFWVMSFILLLACCFLAACNSKQQRTQENKMEKVKIVKIPASKMIVSPEFEMEGEKFFQVMQGFWRNVVDRHKDIFPRDFLLIDPKTGKANWYFSAMNIDTGKFDTTGYEIIDFEGGYYATATAIDENMDSFDQTFNEIRNWVQQSKSFEIDLRKNRLYMTQMPVPDDDELKTAMGYEQLEIFVPIKIRK